MIIALPNLDGSFTVTLFLSYETGEYNFENLAQDLIQVQSKTPNALGAPKYLS